MVFGFTKDSKLLVANKNPGKVPGYCYCTLLKKAGDRVKAGEAIAIVGESGELSDGPHLHFELWLGGEPMDPATYMVFQ